MGSEMAVANSVLTFTSMNKLALKMYGCIEGEQFNFSKNFWRFRMEKAKTSPYQLRIYLVKLSNDVEEEVIAVSLYTGETVGALDNFRHMVYLFRDCDDKKQYFGTFEEIVLRTREFVFLIYFQKDYGGVVPILPENDSIVFEESKSVDSVVKTTSLEHNDSILVRNLEQLLVSERESDVVLKVGEKQFKCHRLILVARSTVFDAMFQQDMSERQSGVVEISDCEPECFKAFLVYVYTGKTDSITVENMCGLYNIADKYALEELKVKCVEYMKLNMMVDSICEIFSLATLHTECELLVTAKDFFIRNMKEIVETQHWESFIVQHPKLVTELILLIADHVKM